MFGNSVAKLFLQNFGYISHSNIVTFIVSWKLKSFIDITIHAVAVARAPANQNV